MRKESLEQLAAAENALRLKYERALQEIQAYVSDRNQIAHLGVMAFGWVERRCREALEE